MKRGGGQRQTVKRGVGREKSKGTTGGAVTSSKDRPPEHFDPITVESKVAHTVSLLLASHESEVLAQSCEALYKYAHKCETNRLELVSLNILPSLLQLISHSEMAICRASAMILVLLVENRETKKALDKLNWIGPFVKAFFDNNDQLVLEALLSCMSEQCHTSINKAKISSSGVTNKLSELIMSKDLDIVRNSLQLLMLLLDDFDTLRSLPSQCIVNLLQLISKDSHPQLTILSLTCLNKLTYIPANRSIVRDESGIQSLLALLPSEGVSVKDPSVASLSLNILGNIIEYESIVADVENCNGLLKIVDCMKLDDGDIQASACATLTQCCCSGLACRMLLHSGIGAQIFLLLHSNSSGLASVATPRATLPVDDESQLLSYKQINNIKHCLKLITTLSGQAHFISRVQVAMIESGTLGEIIVLLSNENLARDVEVHTSFIACLANLTWENVKTCRLLHSNAGALDKIVACVDSSSMCMYLPHVINVSRLLLNLATCGGPDVRESLIGTSQLPVALLKFLYHCKFRNDILPSIVSLLQCLLVESSARKQVVQSSDGVRMLCEMLRQQSLETERSQLLSLVTLCIVDETSATAFLHHNLLADLLQYEACQPKLAQAAIQTLLSHHLPAKYYYTGYLGPRDFIGNGFYDAGRNCGHPLLSLAQLAEGDICGNGGVQPAIFINASAESAAVVTQRRHISSWVLDKLTSEASLLAPPPAPTLSSSSSEASLNEIQREPSESKSDLLAFRESLKRTGRFYTEIGDREGSGGRRFSVRENASVQRDICANTNWNHLQQVTEEVGMSAPDIGQDQTDEDGVIALPNDNTLYASLYKVWKGIQLIENLEDRVIFAARCVSTFHGGAMDSNMAWQMVGELSEHERAYSVKSNILPLGEFSFGLYKERALHFKLLCDNILRVPCSLNRGDYWKTWNEVHLYDKQRNSVHAYIVDLIEQPGRLMDSGSVYAHQYKYIS